jgi:hypothetical protein
MTGKPRRSSPTVNRMVRDFSLETLVEAPSGDPVRQADFDFVEDCDTRALLQERRSGRFAQLEACWTEIGVSDGSNLGARGARQLSICQRGRCSVPWTLRLVVVVMERTGLPGSTVRVARVRRSVRATRLGVR